VSGAVSLLAGLVLESGHRWGEVATPWQWADARAILEPDDGDPLLHFDTRPRGGSKTSDLAGMTAAALVEQVPAGGRCYAIASDRDQARLLVDSLAGFVSRTPGLPGAIAVDRYSAVTPAAARLEVIPADAASSYGLRGSLFVVDELTQWPSVNREVWVSILSAVPKVPGARLVVLASAGDPAHWSYQIRERARVSPAWRLHEVPGPVPWVSESALLEQRELLTDSQYARLHLNRWTASEDRLVTIENLAAAVRLDGPQDPRRGVTYRIGVDLGLRNDRTAIAICHAEPMAGQVRTKRVVLDRMIVFAGTKVDEVKLAEVESVLIEAWKRYGRPRVRLDPWQAIGLAQRLRRQGVSVEEWSYSAQRYGAVAQTLYTLLRDGLLDIYDDAELLDELANVRLKETLPGLVRVEHDPGRHEDRCVALGFAAVPLVEKSFGGGGLHVPDGRVPTVPAIRQPSTPSEPGIPVVGEDGRKPKPRPGETFRHGPFRVPRRGYIPPGSGQR
jgi:phage terminase large subunit-like protein